MGKEDLGKAYRNERFQVINHFLIIDVYFFPYQEFDKCEKD